MPAGGLQAQQGGSCCGSCAGTLGRGAGCLARIAAGSSKFQPSSSNLGFPGAECQCETAIKQNCEKRLLQIAAGAWKISVVTDLYVLEHYSANSCHRYCTLTSGLREQSPLVAVVLNGPSLAAWQCVASRLSACCTSGGHTSGCACLVAEAGACNRIMG